MMKLAAALAVLLPCVLLIPRTAEAQCSGSGGVPFNCTAGSVPGASDLWLGGQGGHTVSVTTSQMLQGLGNLGLTGANPTATINTSPQNGSATTYMRSDAAPAAAVATPTTLGYSSPDNTTIKASAGVYTAQSTTVGGQTCTPGSSCQVYYCEAWITASSTMISNGSCGSVSSGTWTTPSWIDANTTFHDDVIGAGGGGSYCNNASNVGRAGGGGAVSVVTGSGLISAGTGYSFTVGAAGSGGTSGTTTGGNGGNSTIIIGSTTYTGGGGSGGANCASTAATTPGGNATNGLTFFGGRGLATNAGAATTSIGGNSPLGYGFGAVIAGGGVSGAVGTGFGGGGAGATTTGGNGGAGAQGAHHIILSGG